MSGSEPESQVPGGNWESSPVDAEWHESWEAFSAHMEEYYKRTHQIFRQRTSTSVAKRNREITARAARLVANGDEAQAEQLIPEHFVNFWIKLVCTHGWSRKSRSKGIRKSYFDRDTGCKANIKAGVTWNDAEKKFMVRVTDSCVTHNHQVSKARFDNHASNRRVDDPSVLAFVDELQAAGSKPKLIMQYLRKQTGKKVVLRDVHNMVASMRERRRGGVSVEKRLETVMRNFCKTRGNRATVFVDDANTAQTITLQTRQMRRWFKAFPEVLLVDATHNTNESRYKLFSFMLHNMYYRTRIVPLGTNLALKGQYVHHSLMENESEECLTDAIQAFKSNNLSWQDVRVIVIDKDMGELSILKKEFGDVKVILCHFHLKKYIRTEMAKSEYGGQSSFDKDQVEDAVDLMRQATSIKEYTKYLKYMYFLLDGVQLSESDKIPEAKQPFLKYFMRNWHAIKEQWALYARSDVPHLGNHTNNRLETSWGHIKDILKPDMALDECVDTLMFLQAVAEMEYAKKITEVGTMRYREADNELQNLACEVSPHAYRLVEKQYWIAMDRKTHYDVRELHPTMYELTTGGDGLASYHVNTSKYLCSCVFMRTMLLPQVFVKKALSAIRVFLKSMGDEVSGDVVGVKVPRLGIYSDKDIHAMDRWHTAMEYVADTKQAIDWVQNTNIKRIGIPMELQDGVSDIPADREAMIKRIPLRRSRSTPFGGLPYRELLSFCENKWVNDGAMSHGITLLQREHDGVGIVNPLFHRLSDRAARVTAVSVGNPFQEGHHLILVPLHLEDSHWCGAVIDLRSDSRGITIFDPLQAKKGKYYASCKTTLKDLYGELYEVLHVKLETKCRQPDASSCGVAVLMFFECILRGVALPTTPSQSFMRFMRMRYLLKGIL